MANEYGINHIEKCFDAFVVSEVEKEIQYHKGRIKYWAERLEKLEQKLKNNKAATTGLNKLWDAVPDPFVDDYYVKGEE